MAQDNSRPFTRRGGGAPPPLQLWIVGEQSGHPLDWSLWSGYSLVIAYDEHEARHIAEAEPTDPCVLVEFKHPIWLFKCRAPTNLPEGKKP